MKSKPLKYLLIMVILAVVAVSASLRQNNSSAWQVQPNSSVTFISYAPLETIKAESDELKGVLNVETGEFAFSVEYRTFQGFNSPLQREHFNENYVESDKYKTATFTGKIIEKLNPEDRTDKEVRAKGQFNVHGVKMERIIPVSITFGNREMSVTSSFSVFVYDHNIQIPSLVKSKISEEIKVSVNATLVPPAK